MGMRTLGVVVVERVELISVGIVSFGIGLVTVRLQLHNKSAACRLLLLLLLLLLWLLLLLLLLAVHSEVLVQKIAEVTKSVLALASAMMVVTVVVLFFLLLHIFVFLLLGLVGGGDGVGEDNWNAETHPEAAHTGHEEGGQHGQVVGGQERGLVKLRARAADYDNASEGGLNARLSGLMVSYRG